MLGLVFKSTGSLFLVRTINGKTIPCNIRGKLRLTVSKSTNPVVVGDWVDVEIEEDGTHGNITEVKDRRNYIVRKSVNLSRQNHVIAANIDQTCLVVTLINPVTSTEFIDRYLCTAEAYRIPVIIIFNKIDIYDEVLLSYLDELKLIYNKIGYNCISISAKENIGLDELKSLLNKKVSLISGNSGVGKSTLINSLEPDFNLKVAEISNYHLKGKHTTTFSEMFELTDGGFIIDTPGIKGFGLINIKNDELFHYFREIFSLSQNCQYYNCTHTHEPNCAVKDSVTSGEIAESRYRSYLNILLDENEKHRT
ncbi:MAG: ribosome small subunit-dependent GTPase A [Bacteroidia bacterium]|nr:ribosome small subunit-dependent GTPase A [Bacteroidia bacterium]